MATSQGQDIIRCQLCPEPVEHHCNLCHVDLCVNCVSEHLKNKSKRHEVVDFIDRKEEFILSECKFHDTKLCEVYCNDCQEPSCVLCVTTTHKKHDISDIKSIVENLKRRIIVDVEELENIIRPKYRKGFSISNRSAEFDKVMNAIQDQEDNICKVVREIGSQLRDEVAKQKREFEQKNKEVQLTVAKEGEELDSVIKTSKGILKSNDAKCILTYQSKNEQFREGPKQVQLSYPIFLSGTIKENQLQKMFGSSKMSKSLAPEEKFGIKKQLTNPVVLSLLQTPFRQQDKLYRILSEENGNIWISGDNKKIYQIEQTGLILKTITASNYAIAMSSNAEKELLFAFTWPGTTICKYIEKVQTVVDLHEWCPRGLCHTAKGDLLVSMRSVDETQSRVVRYLGTKETRIIQNDSHGKPLFSLNSRKVLLLTENGNGNICVADYSGNAVLVFSASGELRFRYFGNLSDKSNSKSFQPLNITTNVNEQILINDNSSDIIHVIDRDANFLRYIKYPCDGGFSIDPEHNLVAGDQKTGIIRIIKYLQ